MQRYIDSRSSSRLSAMPTPVLVVLASLICVGGLLIIRLVLIVAQIASSSGPALVAAVVGLSLFGLLSLVPILFGLVGVMRGWAATPIIVSLIGVWMAANLLSTIDWFVITILVTATVGVVSVWLPATRAHLARVRADRKAALAK